MLHAELWVAFIGACPTLFVQRGVERGQNDRALRKRRDDAQQSGRGGNAAGGARGDHGRLRRVRGKALRQCPERRISVRRAVQCAFLRQNIRPVRHQKRKKFACFGPMLGQSFGGQRLQRGKCDALGLHIVQKSGQAACQRRRAHEGDLLAGFAALPLRDQGCQQQHAPHRRDWRRKGQILSLRIEQEIIFFHIAEWADIRQQGRAAQLRGKGVAQGADRAPRRHINGGCGQFEGGGSGAGLRNHAARQRLCKGLTGRNGEDVRAFCHHGSGSRAARKSSACFNAPGRSICIQMPSSRVP